MKIRRFLISILTGACVCLASVALFTACGGHQHAYVPQITKPTCDRNGYIFYACACGEVYTKELDALGHDYIAHEGKKETCTENGWKAYNTCSRCDYTDYEEIPMNHNTENNNGYCIGCGIPESSPGLKYSQNFDGTYTVTGLGSCTETDILIGLYNNQKVTSIYASAFAGCDSLTSVEIGDSVIRIYGNAFSSCDALTSVEIGDSVTWIGDSAFRYCRNLASIEIGNSLTKIGDTAFQYCNSLTSIDIPDGVTSIGDYAFYDCCCLTSIHIPNGVTSIGERAFFGCSALTSVKIGNGVTSIGNGAFQDCDSLTSINIPNGVTSIGNNAFSSCGSLTRIDIPSGVASIGTEAFVACSNLIIYCEVASKPQGWSAYWNPSNCPVVWGHTA